MAGRNTILTTEVQERICQALKAGNTRRASALYAGVGESTFYLWLDRATKAIDAHDSNEEELPFIEFMEAVTRAEADCEVWHVANIRQHAVDDARLSFEWLGRRKPSDWSPHNRTDITSGGDSIRDINVNIRHADDASD